MGASSASLGELCTYLSRLELELIAHEDGTDVPSEERFDGAVLFVDVSGFTPITESLAKQGPRGAEVLSEILNDYYGRLTFLVESHGGDVLFFAGDAAVALFRAQGGNLADAVAATTASGLAIWQALDGFAPPAATGLRLSLRATVGAGALRALRVGAKPRLTLITGAPLEQISRLGGRKRARGIVLARPAYELLHGAATSRDWGGEAVEVTAQRAVRVVPLPARGSAPDASAVERAVPEVVVQRIYAGQREFLAEFRTVSVVFVGLVGTGTGLGLSELARAVTALEDLVLRYGGSVYQFLEDDKGTTLIVPFGIPPRTHEDDAGRAALFAKDASAELHALGLETAIGVATGRLFCGAYGGVTRRQYSLVGPTINRAARLMQAAREHGVLCDDATRRAADRHADFEPLGRISLKGLEEPVVVCRPIEGEGTGSSRRRSTPSRASLLVGRSEQREVLFRAVSELGQGQSTGPVLLEAEAGMGKSHMVAELYRIAVEQGVRCVRGDADAMEAETPYYAFRSILTELLGIDGLDATAAKARVTDELADTREFASMAPLLSVILSLDWAETPLTEQMTPQIRAENLTRMLLHIVRRSADREPFLLVLEDGHWLDSASWALAALVRRLVTRTTVVITMRPMDPPPTDCAKVREGATELGLPPMDRDQTLRILEQRFGAAVPPAVLDFVMARAEGNPFYVEEIALSLRDAGSVRAKGGVLEVIGGPRALSDLSFPGSLEAVITSRIDRLAASEQLALKVASVVGRHFEEAAVRDALPVAEDREKLPAMLARLRELDLLSVERDSSWTFRNALTRETTYGLLSYSQRRSLHRAVAEHLERRHESDLSPVYARLAHHYGLAELSAKAMIAYGKAGEQSLGAYANEEAILLLTRALELDERDPEKKQAGVNLRRSRWLKMVGDAHYSLAGHELARAAYESALSMAGYTPPSGGSGAAVELLRHLVRRARKRITGHAAHALSGESRERVLHAMATVSELGAVLLWKGDRTKFLESAFMHRNMADLTGPCGQAAAAMSGAGYVLAMMGLHGLAERDLDAAVLLAEADSALLPRIQAYVMQGMFLSGAGRPERAVPPLRRAGELADELGGGLWKHRAKFMLGEPLVLLGAYEDAARAFGEAAVHSIGAEPTVVGFSYAMQALSELRLGEVDAALALLEGPNGVEMIRPTTVPLQLFASLGPLAEARLARGDREGALHAIREAEAAAPGEEANGYFAGIHGHAAACHVYLTIAEEAALGVRVPLTEKEALAEAHRAVARFGKFARTFPGALSGRLVASGRLAALAGNVRAAQKALRLAASAAERKKMPYEEASAHQHLARFGTGAEPEKHLARARELFARFGMKRELERIQSPSLRGEKG